jgi:AraC-like DNA-binding protein
MTPIASSLLDTDRLPQRERFAQWRDAMSPMHDARLPDEGGAASFKAFARGFNLGSSLVIETRVTSQILSRTPAAIRADQVDHYVIRLQRHGHWSGEANGRGIDAKAGDVVVLDLARPTTACGAAIDNINLLLPRDALERLVPPFDMHGLTLRGPMAALLRNHLASLADNLPHIPRAHASAVATATVNLVAACLAPSRETAARAQAPLELARLTEIRRHIDRHLSSPALKPDDICKALGLSRSTLYAACRSRGGVIAFIRQRRLERIHALLADPREHRRISEIAYQHGFANAAHFSRSFRAAFGVSPHEARAEPGCRHDAGDAMDPASAYRIWLRDLAC